MSHKKYNKIHRLGKEEVEGILDYPVTVQEKIDGANASIWMEDGEIKLGSRNHEVSDFRGLRKYVDNHEGIKKLLKTNPNLRLFGEFLVKHTVSYNETSYNHFYLFDIYSHGYDFWFDAESVKTVGEEYAIKTPHIFIENEVTTEEDIKKCVGQSRLGPQGEGVVIKSYDFVNKFGTYPQFAKVVTQQFKEDNAVTFGGNNKHSETYWEQYVCNEFMTLPRIKKIMQKIESAEGRPLCKRDTPRVSNTAYHDMLEEEIWTIQKKVHAVNFKTLKRICSKKAIKIFHDILDGGDLSVAYD